MDLLEWSHVLILDSKSFKVAFKSGKHRLCSINEIVPFIMTPNMQIISILNVDTGEHISKQQCRSVEEARKRIEQSFQCRMW